LPALKPQIDLAETLDNRSFLECPRRALGEIEPPLLFAFDEGTEHMHSASALRLQDHTSHPELTTELVSESSVLAIDSQGRFLADSMPQIVWTATPDGNLDYFNQRWYDYTGMTFEQAKGSGWADALHPDDIDGWTHAFTTGEVYDVEHRFRRAKDGEYRWHIGRALPRYNEAGEIVQWVGTCTDIDDYKQAQAALLELNDEFRARVNERTIELERSNAELQQFAYVASHDLQEPLRMIASYLELLVKEFDPLLNAEGRQYIGYAVDGAHRMKLLINDLLDYSRLGSNLSVKGTDCESILEIALHNLEVSISESQAVITHDPLPRIIADETQLVRLFQNLINNAIKFRGKDPPRIHISSEQSGEDWQFSFRDNGIGVDPKHAKRIFVIFQRLHNRDKYSGTGIGLAVCKKIVEFHGGTIWIEKNPEIGSTITFTLCHNPGTPSWKNAQAVL
jgi:PAS domain S-box-containing protein